MSYIPIRGFGKLGVYKDTTPPNLPPAAMTDAVNIEFIHNCARKMFGNVDVGIDFAAANDLQWFQPWLENGNLRQAFGKEDGKILYLNPSGDAALTAATPTLSATDLWQSDTFADWGLMNNRIEPPMYSDVKDGSSWAVLPGWGAANSPSGSAEVVRTFKNVLFALGVGTDPYTVYWSAPGTPEAFPTSWDYADVATLAGRKPLNANDGKLIDAVPLADTLMIYTQFATYAVQISNDFKVFNFRRLFSWGLANRDCAVQFENFHFCISSQGVIFVHDGSRIRRVADNKVEDQFFSENSNLNRTFVARHPEEHTMLIYYPTGGSSWPNRILKWNWLEADNPWTFEDVTQEIRCLGPSLTPSESLTWGDLASIGDGTWGALVPRTWGDFEKEDARVGIFMLEAGKYIQRNKTNQRQGSEFYAWMERIGIDLDEFKQTTDQITYLRRVIPQMCGSGQVRFMFGGSNGPRGPVEWGESQLIDLSSGDWKVDTRVAYRYLAMRIGSWPGAGGDPTPLPGQWSITGMDMDIQLDGTR